MRLPFRHPGKACIYLVYTAIYTKQILWLQPEVVTSIF